MRPSRKWTIRSARAARSSECVTIRTVAPSRCKVASISSTSASLRPSRLPVGSSATIRDGSLTSARAIATRCCSPPESSSGKILGARFETDELEHLAHPHAPLRSRNALVMQRQLDVLVHVEIRDQMEALKDEADVTPAQVCELIDRAIGDVLAAEHVTTARRRIDEADDVEHRRLAAARRPHDCDELAALDREIDAIERRRNLRLARVALRYVSERDHQPPRRFSRSGDRRGHSSFCASQVGPLQPFEAADLIGRRESHAGAAVTGRSRHSLAKKDDTRSAVPMSRAGPRHVFTRCGTLVLWLRATRARRRENRDDAHLRFDAAIGDA